MNRIAESLYRAHAEALHRYLVRMSGDSDVAADVLHDTFQRLMERPPGELSNVRGWLFRVATNRLRDVQRADNRRRTLVLVGGERVHSDPDPLPDQALKSKDARAQARGLLDHLNERDRAILLLREEGFTHREIAESVGTTTQSVGTLIARALDRVSRAAVLMETTT